jgi:hypothetical protein
MEKKYIKNLDEKIYFICFVKPCYIQEIANLLWEKNSSSYTKLAGRKSGSGKLSKLMTEKYLKEIKYKKYHRPAWWVSNKEIDGRFWSKPYYIARSDPLIKRIKEKTSLSEFDIYVLQNIFNARYFRDSICNSQDVFNFILKNDVISPIDYILMQFEYRAMQYSKNKTLSEIGKRINDKKLYDYITQKYRNLIEKQDIARYKKKFETESFYEEISGIKSSTDLQKKLDGIEFLLFIPTTVINKIKGSSFLGLIEQVFSSIDKENESISQAINRIAPNLVKFIQ